MTTATAVPPATPKHLTAASPKIRISSIDLLRGLVMLLMPLDHLRDMLYLGHPDPTDLHTTTPILFFTRWSTHFCAPAFVFLSGISAYLAGKRRTRGELAGFLVKRGIWLLFVEVAIISMATGLDPLYHLVVLQVIWAIGGSMILLGLLVRANAGPKVIGAIGLVIFLGHNIIDVLHNQTVDTNPLWRLFVSSRGFNDADQIGSGHYVVIAYALLPWTGVMLLGYALGTLYSEDAAKRKRILTRLGLGMLAFFILFRAFNFYGDPAPWSMQSNPLLSLLSFLNVTKYPCSLLYLCMTLGVALLILANTETVSSRLSRIIIVYGNVPFFYYVVHWFLVQGLTVFLFFVTGHHFSEAYQSHDFPFSVPGLGLTMPGIYTAWLVLVTILYFPCRWFANYKKTHRQWWLSYL